MLFLSFSDHIFSLWYLRQLFKSTTSHGANIFPNIFSSRQISVASGTFVYWRRYDFSPLRHCYAIVVLLPMAVILCFVLQKWWRALFFSVGAKVRGILKNFKILAELGAGVAFVLRVRRNLYHRVSSFRQLYLFAPLIWALKIGLRRRATATFNVGINTNFPAQPSKEEIEVKILNQSRSKRPVLMKVMTLAAA